MRFTKKQLAILGLIRAGNDDGTLIDLDQIIERVPYTTTKESMQFSIRALVTRGLVEKRPQELRRGYPRRVYSLTPIGEHWAANLCPLPVPHAIEQVLPEDELKGLEAGVLTGAVAEI